MVIVVAARGAWKIDGFQNFYDMCLIWAGEIQEKYYGKYSLNFWVANERFPVARLCHRNTLIVELFYYPQVQTAACLSGKAKHITTEKISRQKNLFIPYLSIKRLALRKGSQRGLITVHLG